MAGRVKCKFWDKCYQKNAAHKKAFLHPDDEDDDNKKGVDLRGKKVVFTGALSNMTRKNAARRAAEYGLITLGGISSKVDFVVVGEGAGQKADKAEDFGLRILTEDDYEDLLKSAIEVKNLRGKGKKKRTAPVDISDSEDEEDAPVKPKKKKSSDDSGVSSEGDEKPKKGKKRQAVTHDISESESDDETSKPSPPKKRAVTRNEDEDDDSDGTSGAKLPRCKYWAKCYRKDKDHLTSFEHPKVTAATKGTIKNKTAKKRDDDEEEEEPMDVDEDDDDNVTPTKNAKVAKNTEKKPAKPLHEMADGETVDVPSGANSYRIKRTGDHYYCTCLGWKNAGGPVDKRSCKHLRTYLGMEYERERIGDTEIGAVTKDGKPVKRPGYKNIPQLLLAHKWKESTNPKSWWMSEKLDGVRAYWDGSTFYSRLGNEFVPPAWFIEGFPDDMTLDGELFGGRGKFQGTVSIVKTPGSAGWKKLKFCVFDAPHLGTKSFEKRIEAVNEYFDEHNVPTVEVVTQTPCKGADHLKEELERIEGLGGEGVMIRQPKSQYENGRSHTLLKIKSFHDAEAVVIGHEAGKGRNSSVCGALRCKMACGKIFNVGSGLKDADRRKPPKKGSIITYRFQEYTNGGLPRFPTYIGVRIDLDEPSDAVLPDKPSDD